jgi:hypothetical protein
METTNPQIDANLDALATICCNSINGELNAGLERADALLKSLLMSGYKRLGERPLQVDLETRVSEKCGQCLPRGSGELTSLCTNLARRFANLASRESKTPSNEPLP